MRSHRRLPEADRLRRRLPRGVRSLLYRHHPGLAGVEAGPERGRPRRHRSGPASTPARPGWRQDLSAGDPGDIDPGSWDAAEGSVGAALDDPANADRIRQVLHVTHAPTDPADPATVKGTTLGILWYSFRGTNDAIAKNGGMPFGNVGRRYSGSSDDASLNAGVQRFQPTADPARLAALQTSARLR